MKNFVKHILAIAICAAALLSSCIKEENFRLDTVELTVNLTRADSESSGSKEQGDEINDVMIWAFPCALNNSSGAPTLDDDTKATGFTYATGLKLYQSISVHVPLTVCDGEQSYVVVAVINSPAFDTTISAFGARTTWGALKSATFAKSGDFWNSYPKDKTPEQMPISNWATLTIKNNTQKKNTHSNNQCYQLNLPVHRAVAKTQLYMSKAGNFKLQVLDAKVVANNGYSNGAVLTASAEQSTGSNNEAIQRGKPSEASTTWWWASPTAITRAEGATDPAVTYQLKNSDSGFTAAEITTLGSATNPESGDFTWVASTFLLENDNEAAYGVGVYDAPQGEGYNLRVRYKVGEGGEPVEVYTPLGKVVRNHDYQVKATVDAGGEITLNIEVVDWVEEEIEMTYENTVTIDPNGFLKWTQLPNTTISSETGITYQDKVINMTESAGQVAVCTFALQTPQYGTWHAELITVEGVSGAIAFFDKDGNNLGTSTSGPISWLEGDTIPDDKVVGDPRPGKLIIKTVKGNYTGEGSLGRNLVELRIYATGPAGVYQIPNLPGVFNTDGTIKFSYYQLLQPRM